MKKTVLLVSILFTTALVATALWTGTANAERGALTVDCICDTGDGNAWGILDANPARLGFYVDNGTQVELVSNNTRITLKGVCQSESYCSWTNPASEAVRGPVTIRVTGIFNYSANTPFRIKGRVVR